MEKIINAPLIDGEPPEKLQIEKLCCQIEGADIFRAAKRRIYVFISDGCFWKLVERIDEKVVIRSLFSDEWQASIRDKAVNDILVWLRDNPNLQVDFDKVESDALVHLKNGVFEVATGNFRPAAKEDYFTSVIDANFISDGQTIQSPVFDRFCKDVFHKECLKQKQKLLLQIMGYAISGLHDAKKAFFFIGPSCSGKSVVLRFLEAVLGEGSVGNVPLDNYANRFSLQGMYGKRVNLVGELPIDIVKSRCCDTFKKIVGGDTMEIEAKGAQPFFGRITATLVFAGNALPTFSASDGSTALTERMQLLVFNYSVPAEMRDTQIDAKMIEERDAITTQALRELQKLWKTNYEFANGQDELNSLKQYEEEVNTVHSFVKQECEVVAESLVYITELYEKYVDYTHAEALPTESRTSFRKQILLEDGISLGGKRRINSEPPKATFKGLRIRKNKSQDTEV